MTFHPFIRCAKHPLTPNRIYPKNTDRRLASESKSRPTATNANRWAVRSHRFAACTLFTFLKEIATAEKRK
ncbi:MAG: hypothetical protein AAB658_22085, partial [Chloroflexota bacterium]